MILILTHDAAMKRQLAELLDGLEREHEFFEHVEPLLKAVRRLKKSDHVFYDLQLENALWAFERLHTACKRTNLVAFERQTDETSPEHNQCPAGVETYLLLPAHADRADRRLRGVFQAIAQRADRRARTRRASRQRRRESACRKGERAGASPAAPAGGSQTVLHTITRYLHARSPAMRDLLADFEPAIEGGAPILLESDEGAEFELVAREINFRANGDAHPLYVQDPAHLDAAEFDAILHASEGGSGGPAFVYFDAIETWTTSATLNIEAFGERLSALEDAPVRMILSHHRGTEKHFPEATERYFAGLREKVRRLEIPGMPDRAEDIPAIAHNVFSTLRMAHPFLRTRVLSACAIRFLVNDRENMDYARLTRMIRNAAALSRSDTITEGVLRNLSDDSPMTQHLIESLADERYFGPAETEAARA